MKLKDTLEEAKFAVEIEDLGTVIVDGSGEGEVKARVAKKLKGGKEIIKSVRKITKDKAGKASKALGEELPLYSDYAKSHKSEAIISIDDKKAELRKPFYNAADGVEELKGVILSNFKDDKMLVMAIVKVDKALSDTYKYMNKNYKGWD